MISNYKYISFKELQFKGTVPYIVFVLVVIMLVVVAQNPHEVLLAMAIAYALSGPIIWAYRKQFTKPAEAKVATSKKTASVLKARVAKPKPEPPKSEKAKPGKAKVQKDLNSKDDS